MAIKWTLLGALIMTAMVLYLAAAVLLAVAGLARFFRKWITREAVVRVDRGARLLGWAGQALFGLGSALAAVAFVLRWDEVGHAPLQNMFEVFLCLGMLVWPLSVFCQFVLRAGSPAWNAFLGFVVLFPAAFVFTAEPQHLPPALQSFLFIPHVTAYMLSYVIMAMALMPAALVVVELIAGEDAFPGLPEDQQAHRLVTLGFPLLTLGLTLGAWWGKLAWGDYWNWDPKELWSLVSWLVYLGYFHFRAMYGRRFALALSIFIAAGFVAIVITLLWVNLSRVFGGMHSYAR
jgi:ABC-type transport system involved in cytochrome c biogenesis permease subunit